MIFSKTTSGLCVITPLLLLSLSISLSLFLSGLTLTSRNGHNNSAKKKTNIQPPTQHNPTITIATQTHPKTHSKSIPKSIKTKSNGKPIWKIQQKPIWKTQRKSIRSATVVAAGSTLLLSPHLPCYHHQIQPKWI